TVHAATITVGDGSDVAVPIGCTLREAMVSINNGVATSTCNNAIAGSFGANDTIVFDNALVGSTITLSQGQLSVTAPLTINGSGQTIDAHAQSRVVYVDSAALTASSLTITGGFANMVNGGGVYANYGTVTLSDTTLSGNSATYHGAGICVRRSTLTLSGVTLTDNFAASGGGVYTDYSVATLVNTTITGNHARYGGGIYAYGRSMTLENATVTGNYAFVQGGGIMGYDSAALGINNSILSGNSANGSDPNIAIIVLATATSDHSLLGSELSVTYSGHGNIFSDDPKLSALADNGGPTKTMALQSDSPAIDHGDNTLVPGGVQFDQRGAGHPRVLNGTVDMGAFESNPDEIFKNGFD
ncbi:MAG: choice-of-anchor Q domain-containing protein, partial [Rudaea sp.]